MEIPHYPTTAPLALPHKPLLDEVFIRLQPKVSELTFANLYLFRAAHGYRLTMVGMRWWCSGRVMMVAITSCRLWLGLRERRQTGSLPRDCPSMGPMKPLPGNICSGTTWR